MAKFRKRPVVIEAVQFWPESEPWPDGVSGGDQGNGQWVAWIETLEGDMDVSAGDWIITGVRGERYPCKPDIFELTYEPIETEGARE